MSKSQLILPGCSSIAKPKKPTKRPTQYAWERDSDPPVLGAHSLAKHEVLRKYLQKYVEILTSRLQQEQLKLTLGIVPKLMFSIFS